MILPITVDTRSLDAATCAAQGITSFQLMQRAAGAATTEIIRRYPNRHTRFVVLAGAGNNGGDALVILRRLYEEGYPVMGFLFCPTGKLSADCIEARQTLPDGVLTEISTQIALPELHEEDVIVDGLLGSGLNRPLDGGYAYLVQWINQSSAQVVAIDMPTGLPGDRFRPEESSSVVRATTTLVISNPKLSCYLPECAEFLGRWQVVDIGLVADATPLSSPYRLLTHGDVAALRKGRDRFAHKGTFGHAALIVGSRGMMGAALLSARACMRSGVGLLTVYTPECGYEVMQLGIPEAKCTTVGSEHVKRFLLPEGHEAIGVGCGLGRHNETAELLQLLLERARRPMVWDADALNLLASHPEWWSKMPPKTILTPHPKEADRLLQSAYAAGLLHGTVASPDEMARHTASYDRLCRVRALAREAKVIIVLKGAYTAIALPDGTVWLNVEHGHAGMAVGGSGDVLTGIILGLLAARYTPDEAARLGVYLHSYAADLALTKGAPESWLPSDLIRHLGDAFAGLQPSSDEG